MFTQDQAKQERLTAFIGPEDDASSVKMTSSTSIPSTAIQREL
jgi:hypothetical protein